MNLCTVISHLISDLSSLTTKHMVFSLLWPWTWNEYAYPGTDLRVTQNEFHTSLIPDLLFTSWPNIWVGLVDAQLDQNDCLGIQCFSWSKSEPVIAYPLLLWRCLSQTPCYTVKKKTSAQWNINENLTSDSLGDTTLGSMKQISVF